jgi:hypothetical protein
MRKEGVGKPEEIAMKARTEGNRREFWGYMYFYSF